MNKLQNNIDSSLSCYHQKKDTSTQQYWYRACGRDFWERDRTAPSLDGFVHLHAGASAFYGSSWQSRWHLAKRTCRPTASPCLRMWRPLSRSQQMSLPVASLCLWSRCCWLWSKVLASQSQERPGLLLREPRKTQSHYTVWIPSRFKQCFFSRWTHINHQIISNKL